MEIDKKKVDNFVDELIDTINQKQKDIDELVEFIKEDPILSYKYEDLTHFGQSKYDKVTSINTS